MLVSTDLDLFGKAKKSTLIPQIIAKGTNVITQSICLRVAETLFLSFISEFSFLCTVKFTEILSILMRICSIPWHICIVLGNIPQILLQAVSYTHTNLTIVAHKLRYMHISSLYSRHYMPLQSRYYLTCQFHPSNTYCIKKTSPNLREDPAFQHIPSR